MQAAGIWAALLVLVAGGLSLAERDDAPSAAPHLDRSGVDGGAAFVADTTCHVCHGRQARLFRSSHHDLAMQEATEGTVLGDFGGVTFEHFGVKTLFSRKLGRFIVRTEGPGGAPSEYEIAYTFGVTPLQQYLVHFPGGRLQVLPIAWDTERRRWFHLHPDEHIGPENPFHWTGRYQTWNAMCAECHSTNLRKRYDPVSDGYRTTWSEIDVGCQACHGPGERHVRWARKRLEGGGEDSASRGRELQVDFAALGARGEVDACARCHSRRHRVSAEDMHGRPLLDDFEPMTLESDLYHADGQILGEVYVYGSFLQSRMYAAGVRCTDCHDPHSLSLHAEGNALCTRCHQPEPERRFPGLRAKLYDTKGHHHHAPGSQGALCVSCHMPARTYMVVDPRRDHSIRVPRPDLSRTLGVPNACNDCHSDRSNAWAAARLDEWYGPERQRPADHVVAIHDGRAGDPAALNKLRLLARPGAAPDIVRATAVSLLPGYGAPALETLGEATRDPDPLVRTIAARGHAVLAPSERPAVLARLLEDPIRAVRMEAAAQLAHGVGSASELAALPGALAEYEAVQLAASDLPGGRLNLGVLYAASGRTAEAERAYRTAIAMDSGFLPAYANLAQLLDADGRADDAESVLRDGIGHAPAPAELHYSLGLLLAQQRRIPESVAELRVAARAMPDRARVHYNLGLAEQHLGHADRAEAALSRAADLAPQDSSYVRALAILYAQRADYERAVEYARRLVDLAPESPEARRLLATLERERARVPYSGAGP